MAVWRKLLCVIHLLETAKGCDKLKSPSHLLGITQKFEMTPRFGPFFPNLLLWCSTGCSDGHPCRLRWLSSW